MSETRRVGRAFSLIEVLIAIALLLALVGSMYGFFFDMLRSRASAMEHMQQRMAASALVKQLDADLMACVTADASMGAGIKGNGEYLQVLTRGVAANLADASGNDSALADLQFTEYRFGSDPIGVDVKRGAAGHSDDQSFLPLPGYIQIRFRYHDGTQWRNSFDSAAEGRLPAAVEVAVWFRPVDLGPKDPDSSAFAVHEEDGPADRPSARSGAFDEAAFARQSDVAVDDEPKPDRVRVFAIMDAGGEQAGQTPPDEDDSAAKETPASRPEEAE